jgi:hypothetical protein
MSHTAALNPRFIEAAVYNFYMFRPAEDQSRAPLQAPFRLDPLREA